MGKILCATRGGEASIRTQEAAIQLAKERDSELVFFMVYDMEFMAHANYALRSDVVAEEIEEMCDFLMTMAVERAAKQGVQASYIVREGTFREELAKVAAEEDFSMVILGRPGGDPTGEKLTALQTVCRELEAEMKLDFRILPGEEPAK